MRVFVDSVGCRLNQSEIEKIAAQFRAAGHIIVDSPAQADVVVVNTCSVTTEAASDSRQKIRQAQRAGAAEIAVTGCWASLEPEAAVRLPGVRWVVSNEEKRALVSRILEQPEDPIDLEPLARQPLPGLHMRTRAFIKAQDGCDNHCTYCITRLARGSSASQAEEDVLEDVRLALAGGAREVVLTGVHLGSWGQDFAAPRHLTELIQAILNNTPVERLRLSSVEPWDLDSGFFELWANPRLCRHLHLPLQSGCEATLRRMARKTTPESYRTLVENARRAQPDMAITTDIIIGFPGETEQEFAESLAFVQAMSFADGHVFAYSARPGTPAARYANQVPSPVRKERSRIIRHTLAESAQRFRERFLGMEAHVLWESASGMGPQGWRMEGLTDHYLRVSALAPEKMWNKISRVKLVDLLGEVIQGNIIE